MSDEEKITESALRVEAQNDRRPNPKGRYPRCKPCMGTGTCARCGRDLDYNGPCPAVPPEQRWGEDYE